MIIQGNSENIPLPDNSVDLVVTDPPYGLKFMGKQWDKAIPSKKIFREILRVMKPGAFAFVFCSPRQDLLARMIARLELTGFRTDFTNMIWCYASGFPKAHNLGKRDDSLQGAFAGFQPKPAQEPVLVVMKPLSEKTYLDQAQKNGKGCTWLDDCRVPTKDKDIRSGGYSHETSNMIASPTRTPFDMSQGRYPANLLVSDDALNQDTAKEESFSRYFDLDAWAKEKLPEQVLKTYPYFIVPKASVSEKNHGVKQPKKKKPTLGNFKDNPGRTTPKTSNTPRSNPHPTVKPLKLMAYLIMLGSRRGDLVLDPFVGSGTTGVAADILKRNFLGIELDKQYSRIANDRERAWT